MKQDIYQTVTDRMIAALETGVRPWSADWIAGAYGSHPLRVGGQRYRGINVLLLWMTAQDRGYRGKHWMTFKQALELGGCVRKGEKAAPIVFYKKLEIREENDQGEEVMRGLPMLRQYSVFSVDQIDGLPDRFAPPALERVASKDRDARAEAALRSSGASVREDGGNRAYYDRATDRIHLPAFADFRSVGGFLATMAHELVHWTGAPDRLARTFGRQFGDRDYAFEELVAEIGAAFVCARLGVAGEHLESHAGYIDHWLKVMKDDKRAIFRAAALAQSAADLVLAGAGLDDDTAEALTARPAPVAQPAQLALAI